MKRKGKESKLNVALTALLVVFVCLLSFSIGVISGKGWSDRDYKVKHIEQDSHLKMAQEDNAPIGDEMTDKEVELLTQKALEEAKAEQPEMEQPQLEVAVKKSKSQVKKPKKENDSQPAGREASMASQSTKTNKNLGIINSENQKRAVSSLMPKPTTPRPASIEYTVQVAAYKTMQEAEGHSQKLIDKGFPAFPVQAIIKGDDWYRVSIGSFKTRKQAMKYEKALKKQAIVKSTFVQKIKRLKK